MSIGANFRKLFGAHVVSNLGDGISLVAYPWLASALTRNPILISAVLVTQRLPWLLFSLPIGVTVDRRNRRNLMVGSDLVRTVLTVIVGLAVLGNQAGFPSPDEIAVTAETADVSNRLVLYGALLTATFLLGIGEVMHDTSALTVLPQIVGRDQLAQANGRLASAEQAANLFVGPPLGALLLSGAFALPFFVDAVTFAVSALVLATLTGNFRASPEPGSSPGGAFPGRPGFIGELVEGYRALRNNALVTLFAAVTTMINLTAGMIFAIMIIFAQEVLGAGPAQYSALTIGSAAGSVIGGATAVGLASRTGTANLLRAAILVMALSLLGLGFTQSWIVAAALLCSYAFWLVVWVVHTTSFRQSVIANELLGRVNGVYRFFSYGAIPVGAVVGGVVVALTESGQARDVALQAPFLLAGTTQLLMTMVVAPRLSRTSIDAVLSGPKEEQDGGSAGSDGRGGRTPSGPNR
ncbi:MAG: MFS transporter [Acidimicrobiia bacterium]|nr:MFS transporter [Acidimicrobiia bacterium]